MIKMTDDGYIKFNCSWKKSAPMPEKEIKELNNFRDRLYKLNLIGAYSDGIGFGNISTRSKNNKNNFIISGSATGSIKKLGAEHYTLVTDFSLEKNTLSCSGPIKASSESMTHASIYKAAPEINAVIHVHNLALWKSLLNKVPTTDKSAAYGTPEMAREMIKLLKNPETMKKKIIVMAGHEEGIVTFGKNLDEAMSVLMGYL